MERQTIAGDLEMVEGVYGGGLEVGFELPQVEEAVHNVEMARQEQSPN